MNVSAQLFTDQLLACAARSYSCEVAATEGIGQGVKALRLDAGLTQGELASRAGVRLATVNGWERGRALPRVQELTAVLDALGADLYDLGVAIRKQRGQDASPLPAREPSVTSLSMAEEAIPNAPEEARREWALLHDLEHEARMRRQTLRRRFDAERT
jgi:transcriptional regulator with XRE-family HTH domain